MSDAQPAHSTANTGDTGTTEVVRRSHRGFDWGAAAGILFPVVFVLVSLVFDADTPDPTSKNAPADMRKWLDDSGNRELELVSVQVQMVAMIPLLMYIHRLGRAFPMRDGADRALRRTMLAGGLLFTAMLLVSSAANGAVVLTEEFNKTFPADENTALMFTAFSVTSFTLGAVGATVMLWSASLLGRRTGALPAWLTWSGFVIAVLCLGTLILFGLPVFLLMLWILASAVLLLRREPADL